MNARLNRRTFVTAAAGLALTGCDRIAASKPGQGALEGASSLTYAAQRALLGQKLAPEYAPSAITKVFKPNGSIDPKDPAYKKMSAEHFANYTMPVGGLVAKPRSFTLADLKALPARTQITRHDCVEGWSCIGQWTGVPLHEVLDLVQPKAEARYVLFHCFDNYATDYTTEAPDDQANSDEAPPKFYGSIDLVDAVHPQTLLAYGMNGQALPVTHGAPIRLRVERQLGYKNTKYIQSIELVSSLKPFGDGKGGYWEDQGYEWYGGI